MGAFWRGLLDLFAPATCPACDGVVSDPCEVFCAAHAPLVEPLTEAQATPTRAACTYAGPVSEAVQRLKYARRPDLAPVLARLLTPLLPGLPALDAVVPIPLHARRLRARGYNQAALLARPVARALRLPLRTGLLERVRATPPQARLDFAQRSRNLREAFRARSGVAGRRLLLVDDVTTTGSTLLAAAQALRDAGCVQVTALVLAQA